MFQKQICVCLTKYSQNLRKMLAFFYPQSGAKTSQTWGNNGTPAKLTPHRVLENFFRGTRQDNIILKWYLLIQIPGLSHSFFKRKTHKVFTTRDENPRCRSGMLCNFFSFSLDICDIARFSSNLRKTRCTWVVSERRTISRMNECAVA